MSAAIRFTAVDKRFESGLEALREVSFEVPPGQFAALLGPSGSGKSTILRLVARLDRPSGGTVEIVSDVAESAISCVFQEPTLMPWATLFDNVRLPLRIAGISRAEARNRIAPLLASLDLAGFEGAYPAELSGGMRMRASIARALVTRPRVLLMDEPFAALDEITRARLNDDLLGLWQAHRFTVLFVTHSVFEAVYLSQRVLVMSARPGHLVGDLVVDEPYPRGAELRLSTRYAERCRAVSVALESGYGADRSP